MKAIGAYCPRVRLERLVDSQDIAEHLAMRTGLLEAQVNHVLIELRETVRYFTMRGHSIRLDGLGIYSPGVDMEGVMTIHHRADRYLIKELNKQGSFRGEIVNRENIGKKSADLVALWDDSHPEDPVTD
ncbi:hypothetical protein [Caldilinea sp.]|uniref:HU family DNA-binding protein n=1 Tax=Caldilinea sp. TaxID=2293560 RepID=UPI002B6D78C3|nr:hypothetical protein [Caldilinea sp.]